MTLRFVGYRNGFLIKTSGIVQSFIRKREEFKVNRITQYVESPNVDGTYARIGRDTGVRADNLNKDRWRDGARRPNGTWNTPVFDEQPFHTERRHEPYTIGYQAIDNFEAFDLKRVHIDTCISAMMTKFTYRVINQLTTAANWGGIHVKTAKTLNGNAGFWQAGSSDEASSAYLAIYKTLIAAAREIRLDTNAKVDTRKLQLVVSPAAAERMGATGEINGYLKGSPDAKKWRDDAEGENSDYSLPDRYKKFDIVVMDDPMVTDKTKTDGSEATAGVGRDWIMDSNSALLIPKPAELEGLYGSKGNFSCHQTFWYGRAIKGNNEAFGQIAVTAYPNDEDQLVAGGATQQLAEVLAAPVSGYLITNLFQ